MWSSTEHSARPGIARRMTLTYTVSFIALLGILFVGLYLSFGAVLSEQIDEDLEEDIEEYDLLYRQHGLEQLLDELRRETAYGEHEQVFIRLFRAPQQEIYRSDMQTWPGVRFAQSLRDDLTLLDDDPLLETQSLPGREYATRIVYGRIGNDLFMQLGESFEEKEDIMELLRISFALMFLLSLPIAATVIYLLARRSATSIESVSQAAGAMGEGDFAIRVNAEQAREQETYQLANSFNLMAQRVQALIKEMREMTENIAHDLRSPLGRIRAISEMSLTGERDLKHHRQAAEDILSECDRLLGLINTTLDIAEAEAGIIRADYQQVDLSELLADVCELFEPVAEEKQIQLEAAIPSGCRIYGGLDSLQRMVANLVDNAIKYTPAEGRVAIALNQDLQQIRISVTDNGVGIPAAEQARIFERFFRCDQSRTLDGSGLGLSYSRAVARAHGGDIQLQSQPNVGTAFTIQLPANS